jgi:hypothetical protein
VELFTQELEDEIAESTLLVIQTDRYAERPFCRWEVLKAKQHCRPIFIVNRVKKGEGRVFPYGGNAAMRIVSEMDCAAIDPILLDAMTLVLRGSFGRAALTRRLRKPASATRSRSSAARNCSILRMLSNKSPRRSALSDEERDLFPRLGLDIEIMPLSDLEARL